MPTPDELKAASRHVFYEVDMLRSTADALLSSKYDAGDKVLRFALLESFGVHVRALLDFLTFTSSPKDDVYAALYFASGKWTVPGLPQALDGNVREAINKQFAHVTFTRLKYNPPFEHQWNVHEIATALLKLVDDEFYAKVDPALLSEEWKNGVPKLMPVTKLKTVATGTMPSLK